MAATMRPVWSTACPDWEERIVERRSLVPFEPLFPDEAAAALAVFKSLRMVDVAGQPTFGQACEAFVFDFVKAIFGAYDAKTGHRLIKEFMLLISKKNGKSTIAAGIMLTALIRNWRPEAEMSILAPTQKVAMNSFKPAAAMIRADPELRDLLHIIDNQRLIKHRATGATLAVIAADSQTAGGSKAGMVLVDELWLFGKRANAESMFEEATGGLASRPEGFVIYLTTHSDEQPAGVFKDRLDYFRGVRDGRIDDPETLGLLYEWPKAMLEDDSYLEPDKFYVTNPNIGRSQSVNFIQRKIRLAREGRGDGEDASIQIVLAKYLNVEIGIRLSRDRWRGADHWAASTDPSLTLETLIERCEVLVAGVDGGGLDDLYGLCIAGRERDTGHWLSWCHAWVHRSVLDLRKDIAPNLRDFERDGDLTFYELGDEDVQQVADLLQKVRETGKVAEKHWIGVDAANVAALQTELAMRGFDPEEMAAIGQGYRLYGAIVGSAKKLQNGTMWHAAQALMAWCVGNAKETVRGSAVVIEKQVTGRAKIDPLIAKLNAVKLLERHPVAVGTSVYESRGFLTV